jgi:hypothetical protein
MLTVKKALFLGILLVLPLVVVQPAWAASPLGAKLKNVEAKIQSFIGRLAKVVNGELKTISGNTLTISQNGKNYTVNITNQTRLRRLFWGTSTLAEFSQGDKISVYGKWANEEKSAINATLVRNLSIQKLNGTFFGTISNIDGSIITMMTEKRGNQKVTLTDSTKIVNRKMQTMKVGDLKAGDRIRVKGLWDRNQSTITQVTQLKDFTQPVVKASPKASASPSQE